jgi:hypothetical protein
LCLFDIGKIPLLGQQESERIERAREADLHPLCISLRNPWVVRLIGLDHVIENHQDTVTDCHGSFLGPPSRTDATVLFAQVRLGMPCCMRRLDEHRFGPAIPLTRATTELLSSRFMIAWTDADPGSGMGSVWEVAHVPAQFAE